MASVYPSTQITTVKRGEIPCFAASDIVAGAVVRIASSGDFAVQMVQSASEKPLGVARDYAVAGREVSVFDFGNIVLTNTGGNGAGASFSRESYLGIVGTSTMIHPQSGVTVTFGLLGQVTAGTSPVGPGNTASSTWAVGQAYTSAATGDFAAYRIEPTLLSGSTSSN